MDEDINQEQAPIELEAPSPESVLDPVIEGAVLFSDATEAFVKNFEFYGKPLFDWAVELSVEIPDNKPIDEDIYRQVLVKLFNNLQRASNFYAAASSIADALSGGSDLKRSDLIKLIVQNYADRNAKRPAANIIERMADSYMKPTISASVAAKIVRNFWKQRVETFLELRKVLDGIGFSLHVETKYSS